MKCFLMMLIINGKRLGVPVTFEGAAKPYYFFPLALLLGFVLYWRREHSVFRHLFRAYAALYLLTYAVVNAGLAGNHFAALVPFYMALVLLAIDYAAARDKLAPTVIGVLFALCLLFFRRDVVSPITYAKHVHAPAIARLDALMDACGIDRYATLDQYQTFAFSSHSPWGPLFSVNVDWRLPDEHPLIQMTESNILESSKLFLSSNQIDRPDIASFLKAQFTSDPPDCAKPHLPLAEGVVAWFRK
jgi:hypothetical protein